MKEDEVPEEEEGGGGKQMQKETDFVRKAYVHEPQFSAFTDGGRNPHFSSTEVVYFGSLGFFFLEPGSIITTSGVRGRHSGLTVPGKMGISPPL